MTTKQLQKKSDALLDAIEQHCRDAAASRNPGSYAWNRAAASAAADAYCLREGTQIYVIHDSYKGGAALFRLTADQRRAGTSAESGL